MLIVAYMLIAIFTMRAKQNYFVGVRSPETLGDPKVWKRANRRSAALMLVFTISLLVANTLFAILKLPQSFPGAILVIFAIGLVVLNTYGLKYARRIAVGEKAKKARFPLYATLILISGVLAIGLVWYLVFR